MWLTRLALRNPVLILMVSLMAVVLGIVCLRRLSVDLFPALNIPVIRVATFYTGAGPADIEKSITQPVERAVSATPGVDRVESVSRQGVSVVSVWFNYDVSLDNAQFEVAQRVQQIQNTLPPGIQTPFILKFDITNIPVAQVAVNAEGLDERQLYDLAYNVIEPQLERLPGVASATVGGGKTREITVKADREALRARGLGLLDLVSAVRGANLILPSGHLATGNRDFNVFSNTQVENAESLTRVAIGAASPSIGQSGLAARVADVAEVVDGAADQQNIVRVNGRRGVYLRVLKQPSANTIAVVDALRAALPNLRGVPSNVQCEISFDQSRYIRSAVAALEHEAITGAALAMAIILLFLVSMRATAIVSVAIPLSIVATFILLYFTGQTLNVFTLGGLALGVGRLVDDSIVELENIHRHLVHGEDRAQAVLAAAQEVAMPILVSTITTIVVFFPVLFLTGVAKNVFVPLSLAIAFALIMSFFVSRTVTPLLCYYVLPTGHGAPSVIARLITGALDRLDDAYARALSFVLRHRAVTVVVILSLFAASLTLTKHIGTEFFPESDESQFTVVYKTPIGTRVERTEQVGIRLEKLVEQAMAGPPGKAPYLTTMIDDAGLPLGRTALFTTNTGPHAGQLQVSLVPPGARPFKDVAAAEKVRAALKDSFPGTQVFLSTGGIVKRILNFGAPAPIDVEILGYDLDEGAQLARRIRGAMAALADAEGRPLLTDVQISREENYPEIDVEVDREKAGVLGLTEQAIAQTVLTGLVGSSQFAPTFFTDPVTGNEYPINVRLKDAYRDDLSDLSELFVRSPGGLVRLDTVAHIRRDSGPVQISRKYLQRIIDVTANVAPGVDLGTASAGVQKVLDETTPPEGFTTQLGGQTQAQQQAFAGLGFAGLLALVLVYMVLASQFKSLVDPLVIMFSVPLGLTGVFAMLYATNTTLSVNSFMGIIMMVGIVVSNGVLLVDFANVLRQRGKTLVEATVEAGRMRLRPILMTTIATIAGLIPIAMGASEGSEANLPLARAVIGGLTVSTFFTLFLVPALYTAFDRFARRTTPLADE